MTPNKINPESFNSYAGFALTVSELNIKSITWANLHTVGCWYNMVRYNMILYTTLQWVLEEHKPKIFLIKDTPYLQPMGDLWDVAHEDLEKIYHVITALYCVTNYWFYWCVCPNKNDDKAIISWTSPNGILIQLWYDLKLCWVVASCSHSHHIYNTYHMLLGDILLYMKKIITYFSHSICCWQQLNCKDTWLLSLSHSI